MTNKNEESILGLKDGNAAQGEQGGKGSVSVGSEKPRKTRSELKAERLAKALRDNMAKRKGQKRQRDQIND